MRFSSGLLLVLFSVGVSIYSAQQLFLYQVPTRTVVSWSEIKRRQPTTAPVVLVQDGDQFYAPASR